MTSQLCNLQLIELPFEEINEYLATAIIKYFNFIIITRKVVLFKSIFHLATCNYPSKGIIKFSLEIVFVRTIRNVLRIS